MEVRGGRAEVAARAKINLTLDILGRRPDGYHELRSIVAPVTLADDVSIEAAGEGVSLEVEAGPGVDLSGLGPAEKNLAVRAARRMMREPGAGGGVRIRIYKRIPIGAGLGGGSADAAAVLRGLDALWGLGMGGAALEAAGAELGSDVPALVRGGVVVMEGRGERVRGLFGPGGAPAEGPWAVLAKPGVSCPTAEIYRLWKGPLTDDPGILHNMRFFLRERRPEGVAGALRNGLQRTVFGAYPEVARTAALLKGAGCLGVLLSGSGASVFGIVRDGPHGEEVCRALGPGVWRALARICPVV